MLAHLESWRPSIPPERRTSGRHSTPADRPFLLIYFNNDRRGFGAGRHFCWRNNSGAFKTAHGSFVRAGMPGSPDIIRCMRARLSVVKAPKSDLSDAQQDFQQNLEKAGQISLGALNR